MGSNLVKFKKNLDITNNKNFNGSVYMTLYAQKSDFKE